MTPDGRGRLFRLRALRGRVEAHLETAGWQWSARWSAVIDSLTVMEDAMTEQTHRDLTPAAFNFASCAVCGAPTPVPLTWTMDREAIVVHEGCRARLGAISDEDAA